MPHQAQASYPHTPVALERRRGQLYNSKYDENRERESPDVNTLKSVETRRKRNRWWGWKGKGKKCKRWYMLPLMHSKRRKKGEKNHTKRLSYKRGARE
jgi:tRNA A37 threonylcarbamoyladenosine modification protein TsaB